jgi:hypothetical protein
LEISRLKATRWRIPQENGCYPSAFEEHLQSRRIQGSQKEDGEEDYDEPVLGIGKAILSMHRVLTHDISRRFIFGLTVEDEDVRIYFACRAFLAVSEEFNINEVSISF